MERLTHQTIERMTKAIVDAVDPERVILFGSHARGDQRPDSDVDLLVVESEPFSATRSRRKEMARVLRALSAFTVPIDVLVYSRAEFEKWKSTAGHIVARAVREGDVLYEHA